MLPPQPEDKAMTIRCLFVICLLYSLVPIPASATEQKSSEENAESLLMAGKFDELESIAASERNPDIRFPGGTSKIRAFYGSAGAIKDDCECVVQKDPYTFEQKHRAVEQWLTAQPNSMTARVILVQLFINYAWGGRGHGYANTVTADQWKLYGERMQQAASFLKGLDPSKDPFIYEELESVAKGLGAPRETHDAIFNEAIHNFPRYYHFYAGRAENMEEKWFGRRGELASYTQSLFSSPGGEDGQVAYTFAIRRIMTEFDRQELFEKAGVVWNLLKDSYSVREKRYGLSSSEWNALLYLSAAANDRESARKAAEHIGNDMDIELWKDPAYFAQMVAWATNRVQ
jgi:hypothetical protein